MRLPVLAGCRLRGRQQHLGYLGLEQETLVAQSADIDSVSGSTYTSAGYRTSLQVALDAAH